MNGRFLGIDGGGSKTEVVILDGNGRVIGQGSAGASNFNNIGIRQATTNIREAIAMAAAQANVPASAFTAVFLGIAGVISPADRQVVWQIAQELDLAPTDCIGADHDCRVALAGGLGGAPGIVQIIGTGTSCFGMTAGGERWLAGGWGRLLSDEGGGYWLGIQAMKAATSADDGRGRPTLLRQMVLETLGMDDMGQIMQRLYGTQMPVPEIAMLSHLVFAAARESDAVAMDIIAAGMEEVARCVAAVADYLKFPEDDLRLVCAGGILQAGDVITVPLTHAIQRRLPHCQIESPQFSAAVGAGLLAARQRRQDISPTFLNNLAASLANRPS